MPSWRPGNRLPSSRVMGGPSVSWNKRHTRETLWQPEPDLEVALVLYWFERTEGYPCCSPQRGRRTPRKGRQRGLRRRRSRPLPSRNVRRSTTVMARPPRFRRRRGTGLGPVSCASDRSTRKPHGARAHRNCSRLRWVPRPRSGGNRGEQFGVDAGCTAARPRRPTWRTRTGMAMPRGHWLRPGDRAFPSTVYSNMAPMPLPYRWAIDGDELTIKAEAMGATFHGRWNEEGSVFAGGWRPDPGHEDNPGNVPYDISGSRVGRWPEELFRSAVQRDGMRAPSAVPIGHVCDAFHVSEPATVSRRVSRTRPDPVGVDDVTAQIQDRPRAGTVGHANSLMSASSALTGRLHADIAQW